MKIVVSSLSDIYSRFHHRQVSMLSHLRSHLQLTVVYLKSNDQYRFTEFCVQKPVTFYSYTKNVYYSRTVK